MRTNNNHVDCVFYSPLALASFCHCLGTISLTKGVTDLRSKLQQRTQKRKERKKEKMDSAESEAIKRGSFCRSSVRYSMRTASDTHLHLLSSHFLRLLCAFWCIVSRRPRGAPQLQLLDSSAGDVQERGRRPHLRDLAPRHAPLSEAAPGKQIAVRFHSVRCGVALVLTRRAVARWRSTRERRRSRTQRGLCACHQCACTLRHCEPISPR